MFILLFASAFAESIVEMVNNNPESTWVAVEYPERIMNKKKLRATLGTHVEPWEPRVSAPANDVPDEFDCRQQWPNIILPIRDQASCGSCWAFSIAEVMGNRFGIQGCSKGVMSPQDLVSCDTTNYGCNGGNMLLAWIWTKNHGIATEQCIPYQSQDGTAPACPAKCSNGTEIVRYTCDTYYKYQANNMQHEIITRGPIQVAFTVYEDFYYYKSGVYKHTSLTVEGGHAVICIGWGTEDGLPYWLIQNSWGPEWGEAGCFKILRGVNECGIEDQAYAPIVSCR